MLPSRKSCCTIETGIGDSPNSRVSGAERSDAVTAEESEAGAFRKRRGVVRQSPDAGAMIRPVGYL